MLLRNVGLHVSFWISILGFLFFLGIYLVVELLGHMVTLCLTFWETAKLFSKVAVPFYIKAILRSTWSGVNCSIWVWTREQAFAVQVRNFCQRFSPFFFFFLNLFLAVLGLRFCARAFSSCGKRGPLFIAVRGPLHYCGLFCCGAQAPDAQAQ